VWFRRELKCSFEDVMVAAEVFPQRGGILHANVATDQRPPLRQRLGWTSHLEVIDIHNQEQSKFGMGVTGAPIRDGKETDTEQVLMAMFFPVSPRIRVTVQRKFEGADGVMVVLPRRRAPLGWNANPCNNVAAQFALNVRLFGVGLLNIIVLKKADGITGLASLKGGGRGAELLKQRNIPILITDLVSLEDDTALKFAGRVVRRELAVLLDTNFEDKPNVGLRIRCASLTSHILPLTDSFLVPTASFTQICPLLLQSCLGLRVRTNLRLAHRTGHSNVEGVSNGGHMGTVDVDMGLNRHGRDSSPAGSL